MYLPQDLIAEILSRLPLDSILRFRTVCNDWRSLIEDPAFIDRHMAKSEGHWVYTKNFAHGLQYKFKTSCYGLVLERCVSRDKYVLKNPSTRKILDLPIPQDFPLQAKMDMCHVHSTDELKLVVHNNYARDVSCNVLTVGIDSAWRNIDTLFPTSLNVVVCQTQMVKENYFMLYSDGRASSFEIICLEMGSEQCCSIDVPSNFFPNCKDVVPLAWEGILALVGVIENELHVWVLEDREKQRWAEKKIVIPLKLVGKYWLKMRSFKDLGLGFGRRFDIIEDLSFCEFRGDSLLIKFGFGEMALVDVSSGRITDQYYAPEGNDFGYYLIPSLVHLKGMQPQ